MMKFGKVSNNPDTATANIAPAIEMGIKNAPTRLIVGYLTKMYTYPLPAAIRETISNAVDASISAGHDGFSGVSARIVENGDLVRPSFSVRDDGPGMGYDKLVEVYTQYGVSDKRDDGAATGAFGLGAKSPLAYTDEFHVITKSADEGCYYVHCYRTPDDDFLADPPMKVDGSAEFADNLAAAKGYEGRTITVADPFAPAETGTVVSFPLSWGDGQSASDIIDSIDKMLHDCGGKTISGPAPEHPAAHYHIGDYELSDADGDSITVGVYVTDKDPASGSYSSRSLPNLVDAVLSTDEGLDLSDAAFKVGNWYYPADGSAWRPEHRFQRRYCNASMIVEVPSKALPFVPSRDTIIADSSNSNARELVKFAAGKVREFMQDRANMTDLFSWFVGSDTINLGRALQLAFPVANCQIDESELANHVLRIVGSANNTPYARKTYTPFDVEIDLDGIEVIPGMSYGELLDMPNALVGFVEARNDGRVSMKNGPLVCSGNRVAQLVGNRYRTTDGKAAKPGFALSKSKKACDSLTADGFSAAEPIRFALKSDQESFDSSKIRLTAGYPAGLGITALAREARWGSLGFVIVDGSEYGLSKVRSGIGRIFENKGVFGPAAGAGIFAVIPPREGGWDESEKDDFIAKIEKLAKGLAGSGNVVIVRADDVAVATAKTAGSSAVERGELDKMLRLNRTVYVVDTGNQGYGSYYGRDHFRTSYRAEKDLAAKIAADPQSWGVVVASSGDRPYETAQEYAKLAYAMDLVPERISNVACISSVNFNDKRAAMLDGMGVEIIYDENGSTPFDTLIPAHSMRMSDGKIVYSGPVPENILRWVRQRDARVLDNEITALWSQVFSRYYYRSDEMPSPSSLVKAFTFGYEEYADLAEEGEVEIESWIANQFNNATVIGIEGASREHNIDKMKENVRVILNFWASISHDCGFELNPAFVNAANLNTVSQIGEAMGIRSAVDAYYAGVPVEDIIGDWRVR